MLKDIPEYAVEDVAIAVVNEKNSEWEMEWNVYVINLKAVTLESVLVTSTGYGIIAEEEIKTCTLRHSLENIPANSFGKVEPIMESVFFINNEYWLSFYLNNKMYDKKYVFLAESIREENFTLIPVINKRGVMIK